MRSTQVTLEDRHAEWRSAFEQERQRITAALGSAIECIEHVGSTAIPGVPAKPVLDILIVIRSFEAAFECVGPMESLGYEYRGEYGIPRSHYFVLGEPRTHHVHMLEAGSGDQMLHFRDLLRRNELAAQAYADAKRRLARDCSDKGAYQAEKDAVVAALLRKFGGL